MNEPGKIEVANTISKKLHKDVALSCYGDNSQIVAGKTKSFVPKQIFPL